tara:strand:- start:67 stop:930 length:864 start_codon:yes stop_codon:yes gene_type:complete
MCSGFGGLEKPMQSEPFDYSKGIEDLLDFRRPMPMAPDHPFAQIKPYEDIDQSAIPEDLKRYGEQQGYMGGQVLDRGYYAGPADGVYRYGEGPFAEETQRFLDSIGMTADEFAGPKPDNTLPLLAPLPTPDPVIPQIPMQEPEVIKPTVAPPSMGGGGDDLPTIGGGIGGQPTIVDESTTVGETNPFNPFGNRGGMGRQGVRPYLESIISLARNKELNDINEKTGPYIEEVQQITDRTFPDLFSGSGMGSLGGFYGGGMNQFYGMFPPKVDQISQPMQGTPYKMGIR